MLPHDLRSRDQAGSKCLGLALSQSRGDHFPPSPGMRVWLAATGMRQRFAQVFLQLTCCFLFVHRGASVDAAHDVNLTWRVMAVQSDLDCESCSVPAFQLLMEQSQTQCDNKSVLIDRDVLALIDICLPCDSAPFGPGYYCNSGQIELCPPGYHCPTYLEKIECPEDTWCKAGFTEPMDCKPPVVRCPAGSEQQFAGAGFVECTLLFVIIGCVASLFIKRKEAQAKLSMQAHALTQQQKEDTAVHTPFASSRNLGEGVIRRVPKVEIEFEDLSMALKSNGSRVLNSITGKFPPASLVALMGPSGSGKTTFMNALSGRAGYGIVTGQVRINHQSGRISDIPKMTGFVPQDDVMLEDLTVQQNLFFNGCLRLPRGTATSKIAAHTEQVMETLGLDKIKDNIIGSVDRRGISGGQKKRVNIGMELMAMPAVIFMDEPTSGLDGAATLQLANCLSNLRESGILMVCVIHQPRYAVFSKFSHLLLLGAGGGQVYCGELQGLEHYLVSLGFRCPPKENPADWMIDVTAGLAPRYLPNTGEPDPNFHAPKDLFRAWTQKHKGRPTPFDGGACEVTEPIHRDRLTPLWVEQTTWFLLREATRWDRTFLLLCCVMLFAVGNLFGFLVGTLAHFEYSVIIKTLTVGSGLFYMMVTITSRSYFGYERLQYLREFSSGTSCTAYWLAKMAWSTMDLLFWSFSYAVALYWASPIPAQDFIEFFLAYLAAAWYHAGFGMLVSILIPTPTTSLLFCTFLPTICDTTLTGSITKVKDMNVLQKLASTMTCGRWVKQTLYINEMRHYPNHTLDFPMVNQTFAAWETSLADGNSGLGHVFYLGLAFRLLALALLLLYKYAEGDTLTSRVVDAGFKMAEQMGLELEDRSAADSDLAHAAVVWHRNAVTGEMLGPGDSTPNVQGRRSLDVAGSNLGAPLLATEASDDSGAHVAQHSAASAASSATAAVIASGAAVVAAVVAVLS